MKIVGKKRVYFFWPVNIYRHTPFIVFQSVHILSPDMEFWPGLILFLDDGHGYRKKYIILADIISQNDGSKWTEFVFRKGRVLFLSLFYCDVGVTSKKRVLSADICFVMLCRYPNEARGNSSRSTSACFLQAIKTSGIHSVITAFGWGIDHWQWNGAYSGRKVQTRIITAP